MSLSNSKSASSSSTTSKPVSLQDISGVAIAGNEGAVNLTDGGAIKGGLDLARTAIEQAAALTLGLVGAQADASSAALSSAMQAADSGYKFAMDAGRSDISTIQGAGKGLLYLAGIAAAAYVLSKWSKK